jgi:hypothetical protein
VGSFGVSEFINNFFVSGFDLSESDSVKHVVNKFGSLIKGVDLDGLFIIFISPFFVSGFSFSSSDFDGIDGFVIIFNSLSELDFSLS